MLRYLNKIIFRNFCDFPELLVYLWTEVVKNIVCCRKLVNMYDNNTIHLISRMIWNIISDLHHLTLLSNKFRAVSSSAAILYRFSTANYSNIPTEKLSIFSAEVTTAKLNYHYIICATWTINKMTSFVTYYLFLLTSAKYFDERHFQE